MQETSLKFFMISLISVCKDISAGINVICSCTSTSITVKKKKKEDKSCMKQEKKNFTQQYNNCGGGYQFYMIISLPVYF